MLGLVLAALSAPQPAASPLKTITHIRSSPFCATLHDNVGRTVGALIKNNIAIDRTKSLFLKMARDKVFSANRTMVIDMDINSLGPMIDTMARNLAIANALLNDSRHFTAQPQTDDERQLAKIRTQLADIVDHQNTALNTLSGTFYSYNGNRLLGHGDGLKDPVDPPEETETVTPIVVPPLEPPSSAAATARASSPQPPATPASIDLGLLGLTRFAGLFNNLTAYQVNEQRLESQAAQSILQSSEECNSSR